MGRNWSDENRFRTWLAVEIAATETLAEAGRVPKEAAKAICERADFRLERINEIEAEVRHDVIAFTTAVAEIVGPEARWFHYGLTSNDVVDTAQALLIGQASKIIAEDLRKLSRSEEHTSELQSRQYLVCRLLLEKKKTTYRHCLAMTCSTSPDSVREVSTILRNSSL